MEKKAIITVSFGTSYPDARERAIGGIEQAVRDAFPACEVRRCFTSGMVIRHIRESEGIHIDNPREALERAAADGVTELLIQPTHVMSGAEHDKFMKQLQQYSGRFASVKTGAPLLAADRDFEAVMQAIRSRTDVYDDGNTAVLLIGHGSQTEADRVYDRMQKHLHNTGYSHYYVGTIETRPSREDIAEILRQGNYRRAVLVPFMVVAGDHALHDIAGEEDSWKQYLTSCGYETEALLQGLGEYPQIQDIYVRHLQEAKECK